jgi:hypothetical protein
MTDFKDDKICSMPSFRAEVKLAVPCHKILLHVKNPCSIKEILMGKVHGHGKIFSVSLLNASARYCQRTQMGKHNR